MALDFCNGVVDDVVMEILSAIDSVLEDEQKTSTYKFALLVSIMDYVMENPSEVPKNGFHLIPLIYLARQFLYYYHPLAYFGESGVRQTYNPGFALYTEIWKYIPMVEVGGVLTEPEGVKLLRELVDGECLPRELVTLLVRIRWIILDKPLSYIKLGADLPDYNIEKYRVKRRAFALFGLTCEHLPPTGSYEEQLRAAKRWGERATAMAWEQLEAREHSYLKIGRLSYQKLSQYRTLIRDAVIKRWIEFSVENYLRNDGAAVYHLISSFERHATAPERDSVAMRVLRSMAEEIFHPMRCFYCERELEEFALDHIVPWSRFPTNYFWNLVPSCTRCNSRKGNRVLEMDDDFLRSAERYLRRWVRELDRGEERRRVAQRYGGRQYQELIELQLSEEERVGALLEHLLVINDNIA